MDQHGEISWELLRTLAEKAWDSGDRARAGEMAGMIDAAMLQCLQDEGSQVGADEMPLIVPADRA